MMLPCYSDYLCQQIKISEGSEHNQSSLTFPGPDSAHRAWLLATELQCCSTRNTTGKCWQKATVVLISILIGLQNIHSSNSISFPWFYQQPRMQEQVHWFVSQQVPNKPVLGLCSNSTFLPSERCSCLLRQQKRDLEITSQHWSCSFYCFWNLLGELKIPKGCNILSALLVTHRTQWKTRYLHWDVTAIVTLKLETNSNFTSSFTYNN